MKGRQEHWNLGGERKMGRSYWCREAASQGVWTASRSWERHGISASQEPPEDNRTKLAVLVGD